MNVDGFVPWIPLPNLKGLFTLEELRYDGDELYLRLLSESDRGLEVKVSLPLEFSFSEFDDPDAAQEKQTHSSFWTKQLGEFSAYIIYSNNHGFVNFETDVEPHISWVDNFFGDAI